MHWKYNHWRRLFSVKSFLFNKNLWFYGSCTAPIKLDIRFFLQQGCFSINESKLWWILHFMNVLIIHNRFSQNFITLYYFHNTMEIYGTYGQKYDIFQNRLFADDITSDHDSKQPLLWQTAKQVFHMILWSSKNAMWSNVVLVLKMTYIEPVDTDLKYA